MDETIAQGAAATPPELQGPQMGKVCPYTPHTAQHALQCN